MPFSFAVYDTYRPSGETIGLFTPSCDSRKIRGVAVGSILKSLHERGLIDVVGRAEGLGRPLLYGTTPNFLEQFALRHLEELPRADELAIALRTEPRAL